MQATRSEEALGEVCKIRLAMVQTDIKQAKSCKQEIIVHFFNCVLILLLDANAEKMCPLQKNYIRPIKTNMKIITK